MVYNLDPDLKDFGLKEFFLGPKCVQFEVFQSQKIFLTKLYHISAKEEEDPNIEDDEIDMGEDEDVDVESDDEDIDTKADQDLDDSNDELNEMRSKLVHPRPLFGKVTKYYKVKLVS